MDFGRDLCTDLAWASRREWLCANGIGGYASGTVAGFLNRRYHGLLVAALAPPLGRTLLVAKLEETARYGGRAWPLAVNRWADGSVSPDGYRHIERFRLEGTTPVWTFALGDALLEKRLWMEPGANTTYLRYEFRRGSGPLVLELEALVNYRDHHGLTQAGEWRMTVEPVPKGLRVVAFEGARETLLLSDGAKATPAHDWYYGFSLAEERERGFPDRDDHLMAGSFLAKLEPGGALTLVASAEATPLLDGDAALKRRQAHERGLMARWKEANPDAARAAPPWIQQLVLAADQFVVRRPSPADPDGRSIIAGYPWFADWGRDTMLSLPGLTLATGRASIARAILKTWASFADRGLLPNRFPDAGEAPEYNTADAALWYIEAVRAYDEATGDHRLLAELRPVLEEVIAWHVKGTRHGIQVDPEDGLLRAGEPGLQLTWMDARVGDWVVTPRIGKPVEVNALWYNALRAMVAIARRLGKPAEPSEGLAARAAEGFAGFWNPATGHCYDVLDAPDGHDPTLRPNQILAVALPESPLTSRQKRSVLGACARHLLTSFGLRSLAPGQPDYRGRYTGGVVERDGAYHQGAVWGWLLGPFVVAHLNVFNDPAAARAFLLPMAHHLAAYGLGTLGEIFDGDPPHTPRGCIAQAWTVAEVLRAWLATEPRGRPRS